MPIPSWSRRWLNRSMYSAVAISRCSSIVRLYPWRESDAVISIPSRNLWPRSSSQSRQVVSDQPGTSSISRADLEDLRDERDDLAYVLEADPTAFPSPEPHWPARGGRIDRIDQDPTMAIGASPLDSEQPVVRSADQDPGDASSRHAAIAPDACCR